MDALANPSAGPGRSMAGLSARGTSAAGTSAWEIPAAVAAMLEARSVALVGASQRPGSLGERMVAEVSASPSRPRLYPVNPRYTEIGGRHCHPSLGDVPEPVDLVLLGVPDAALEQQLTVAAARGDASAVIFGSAYDVPGQPPGLRGRLASIATTAAMALCGAGCMGFVNVARGLRAVGYVEPRELRPGPVALVTHSGSVFSTLLRSRRGFGFSLAVSSGQELVTTAASYARYALGLPQTRVLALILETIRDAGPLRSVLADADAAGIPVVLLAAGCGTPGSRSWRVRAPGSWPCVTCSTTPAARPRPDCPPDLAPRPAPRQTLGTGTGHHRTVRWLETARWPVPMGAGGTRGGGHAGRARCAADGLAAPSWQACSGTTGFRWCGHAPLRAGRRRWRRRMRLATRLS